MSTSPLGSGSGRRNPFGDRRFVSRVSTSSSETAPLDLAEEGGKISAVFCCTSVVVAAVFGVLLLLALEGGCRWFLGVLVGWMFSFWMIFVFWGLGELVLGLGVTLKLISESSTEYLHLKS